MKDSTRTTDMPALLKRDGARGQIFKKNFFIGYERKGRGKRWKTERREGGLEIGKNGKRATFPFPSLAKI